MTTSTGHISRKTHRLAVGALFFLLGLCFASWASRIPSVQQTMGISEAGLGGVLLAIPLGQLVSLPLAGWLVAREGSRKVVLWGVLLYAAALVGLGWAANLYQLLPCLVLFGIGGNLTNISVPRPWAWSGCTSTSPLWPLFMGCGAWPGSWRRPWARL
ncbi:MFS transporter [Hymenobacter antarcticus]|uniref:MFS transporter n=1 Tax=Hymenobacter antarcticus TaxID=486270 RepID=UPI0031EFD527